MSNSKLSSNLSFIVVSTAIRLFKLFESAKSGGKKEKKLAKTTLWGKNRGL
jgi:hypothetical protein